MTNNESSSNPYNIDLARKAIADGKKRLWPNDATRAASAQSLLNILGQALQAEGFTTNGVERVLNVSHPEFVDQNGSSPGFQIITRNGTWVGCWQTARPEEVAIKEITYDPVEGRFVGPDRADGAETLAKYVLAAFLKKKNPSDTSVLVASSGRR